MVINFFSINAMVQNTVQIQKVILKSLFNLQMKDYILFNSMNHVNLNKAKTANY